MVLWEALDALSHQLELCNVTAETQLAVLIDTTLDRDQVAQIQVAVARSGARAIEVHIAPDECVDNQPLAAAVAASDLVITTGRHTTNPSPGTSPLLHLHPIAPQAFPPHASLRRRVQTLVSAVEAAGTMRLSDTNGSQVTVSLATSETHFDHGFVGDGHRRASFPAGWVSVIPAAGTVNGQVVLMPGDANLGADRLINSPLVLHLVDDHISSIEGESPDADIMRALLEHPGKPSAYGLAEVSIGLNPGAPAAGPFDKQLLDPVVSRLLAGVVQLSFGENLFADRPCPQTITLAMRGRSLHLDALPVVLNGRLDGDVAPDVYEL